MTHTSGTNINLVVADTDALIALLYEDDENFDLARRTLEELVRRETRVVFPVAVIAETVTTLQRKLNQPHLASHVIDQVRQKVLDVASSDEKVLQDALNLFDINGSKQDTIFDAIVAATAQRLGAQAIFSFDKWYAKKLGFRLASDLVQNPKQAA